MNRLESAIVFLTTTQEAIDPYAHENDWWEFLGQTKCDLENMATWPLDEVMSLAMEHQFTWSDKPESYWAGRLLQEMSELMLGLDGFGEHKEDPPDSPDLELLEIASIALNWLKRRANKSFAVHPLRGQIEAIREFEAGPEVLWYVCKGHDMEAEQFVMEIARQYGEDFSPEDVEYTHLRNVPAGTGMPGVTTLHRTHPGLGAYAATVLDRRTAVKR